MNILVYVLSIFYVLLFITTIILILTDRKNYSPSKAVAWLVLIIILPVLGLLLYFVFGLDMRRIRATEKEREVFYEHFASELPTITNEYLKNIKDNFNKIKVSYQGLATLIKKNNYSGILCGSNVEIITDGNEKLNLLIKDLENAQETIHFEYFLFRRDAISRRIRDILMRKAEEGVEVRFIYDNIANIDILPSYYNKMRKSGVQVNSFTKLSFSSFKRSWNNRNHRKIVVIDGQIGYVGGMNITSQTQRWRDTHLRIQGQGVHGLQLNFLQVWYSLGGDLSDGIMKYFPPALIYNQSLMQISPEAPDTRFPYYALSIVKAIENAKKYIYIQTPYYSPTDPLMRALKSASLSGVEVRLIVSKKSDFILMDWAIQGNYEKTLEADIHIHEIQDYFSHAKTMVIDDYLSIIGSSNLDYRSLELNFEINSFIYDEEIAIKNRDIFIQDLDGCLELSLEEWRKRPWWRKICEMIMRFFSPLL